MRILAFIVIASACLYPSEVFALEGPCTAPEPFQGYWGRVQVQVRERLMGIPILATARVSYRQIRYSPCVGSVPAFPPGIGDGIISLGIPLIDNRRGGWVLQLAVHGQGSQRTNEPISGFVTGAPATAGHLNIWETPFPLIQLTGAASAAIVPQSSDVPLSIAYLGGARVYLLYAKRAQVNFGLMVGGSNGGINIVPSFAFRLSDVAVWSKRMAIGFEFRAPVDLLTESASVRWRLWGALTFTLDAIGDAKNDHSRVTPTPSGSFDIVRSVPESAPPVQTAWEMTL